MAILLPFIYLQAGNSSYYVTTNNDTVWGVGLWPRPGFDGQTSIMFVDVDSNLLELKPDTVFFVVIEKDNAHEVFKSTKTDLWGYLFLHQIVIDDVAVLWGYDFVVTTPKPMATEHTSTTFNGKTFTTMTTIESHFYITEKLKSDPFPGYVDEYTVETSFMYYLQKGNQKAKRVYDINFRKQMSKYFAGNAILMETIKNGKLKYTNMGWFLSKHYFIPKERY